MTIEKLIIHYTKQLRAIGYQLQTNLMIEEESKLLIQAKCYQQFVDELKKL